MFQRLKEKWQLSWPQFILVFFTFALGGSLCGYTGKLLMKLTGLPNNILYYIIYIILVSFLWPFCVILASLPLGQLPFFRNYLRKIWKRIGLQKALLARSEWIENNRKSADHEAPLVYPGRSSDQQTRRYKIAIFASGAGSNAEKIIAHFRGHPAIEVALVACNKPGAGVLSVATAHAVPVLMIEKEKFFRGSAYVEELKQQGIRFIVLAGFLWKVPNALINAFPNHIINIHPALLPKYGGKGMYGMRVHEAVIAAGEKESGITIHYVNEHFDNGETIFQARCPIEPGDTPELLAQKIHVLEHLHFPQVVERAVSNSQ